MRLIDADALSKQLHDDWDEVEASDFDEYFLSKQPTAEVNKWIPVSERLPEERRAVLVWCPQYQNIYCACLEKEQWWIFGAFVQIVPNEVIAWMPLPEPYKESEEI